ncbi:MAG: rhomboid family intramembrane serine protease [Actinomycetota bacterium]
MAQCPACRTRLTKGFTERGVFWHCSNCGGRTVGIGLLRRLVVESYIASVWRQVAEHGIAGGPPCPFCEHSMIMSGSSGGVSDQLDVCTRCQIVWFDAREFERAPALAAPPRRALSQEALEALGRFKAAEIAESMRFVGTDSASSEDTILAATAVLGLPVEEEAGWLKRNPWVSWGLVLLVAVWGIAGLLRPGLIRQFGLIPGEPFRLGAATFITSLFFHAGELQLLASIYFLALFGDNVEDYLGRGNYVLLLLIAGLAGGVLHILFTGDELRPAVGASPAVAGIVVFYALQFPRTKMHYLHTVRWHSMPASAALMLWLASQVITTRPEFLRTGTSSVWIYVGGAASGLLFWRLFRETARLD